MSETGGVLVLDHVSKWYDTNAGVHIVFDGLTATFPPGRRYGILGRNGSGKSTLLRIIAGATRPDAGEVIRPRASFSWPIGLTNPFVNAITARDNVRFVARLYAVPWEPVFDYVAAFSELGPYLDMPLATYSSGMRSRFNVGLSLAVGFNWYLMDEALSVGDRRFRDRTATALQARLTDTTLVLVSHNSRTIRRMCDTVGFLEGGRLRFTNDVEYGIKQYDELVARV